MRKPVVLGDRGFAKKRLDLESTVQFHIDVNEPLNHDAFAELDSHLFLTKALLMAALMEDEVPLRASQFNRALELLKAYSRGYPRDFCHRGDVAVMADLFRGRGIRRDELDLLTEAFPTGIVRGDLEWRLDSTDQPTAEGRLGKDGPHVEVTYFSEKRGNNHRVSLALPIVVHVKRWNTESDPDYHSESCRLGREEDLGDFEECQCEPQLVYQRFGLLTFQLATKKNRQKLADWIETALWGGPEMNNRLEKAEAI